MHKRINMLREFSVPLICGIVLALVWSNLFPDSFTHFNHDPLIGPLSFQFLTNNIFMVLFFGIAAAEITQSCLPGGDLHPLRKAINPILAMIGGVTGPVLAYFGLNAVIGEPALNRGWGIPTATDIALAWLVARIVFGGRHPAISFLLLLAIADDAVGLAIIAIFYPDPSHVAQPAWLMLTAAGMAVAYTLRRFKVVSYWPYLLVGGVFSWIGLFNAHLHPSLALVGLIAGIGLTVALFVAGEAFTDPVTQGAAKMGALFSGGCAFIAILAGRILKIRRMED
jgi:Na+:H+ antiporter, NhaA family